MSAPAEHEAAALSAPQKLQPVKIEYGELPCWVTRTTARGRWLSSSYFEVPSEEYCAGYLTGARLALDLIRLVRGAQPSALHVVSWRLRETCREAASVACGDGRHGAAAGFLNTMHGVLLGGILHTSAEAYAAELLLDAERSRDYFAQREKNKAAEFVRRMKSARAAARRRAAIAHVAQSGGTQPSHERGAA